jgi:hypothetical protein
LTILDKPLRGAIRFLAVPKRTAFSFSHIPRYSYVAMQ